LILGKIIKIVTTKCQILRLNCIKFDFGWGSARDPAGGAYSAPPDPLAGFKGVPTSKGREGKGRGEGGEGRGREKGKGREGKGERRGMRIYCSGGLAPLHLYTPLVHRSRSQSMFRQSSLTIPSNGHSAILLPALHVNHLNSRYMIV